MGDEEEGEGKKRLFNPVTPAALGSIRPDFLNELKGKKKKDGGPAGSDNPVSAPKTSSDIWDAEKKATDAKFGGSRHLLNAVRAGEEKPGKLFSGVGRSPKGGGKQNLKGKLKKGAPLLAILGALVGFGGGIMGAQSIMPFAIEEMIIEKFNSIGVSSTITGDNTLNTQLNQGTLSESEKRGDDDSKTFAFSEYQVQQFATQGIKVIDNVSYGSTRVTVLLYKSGGQYKAVVGSNYLGKITDSAIISAAGISAKEFGGQVSVSTALSDPDFKTPYTTASKSWRGGISGWFDNLMSGVTEVKLSINRNRWTRYATRTMEDLTKGFKKIAASEAVKNTTDEGVSADEAYQSGTQTDPDTGEQKPIMDRREDTMGYEVEDGSYDANPGKLENAKNYDQINKILNSKAIKAAGAAAEAGEFACAVLDSYVSIYTVVSAYQNMQFLNLISGFLESVDKVKAGDGNESPIHEYGESLTVAAPTRDNEGKVVKGKENKTAMESAGMAWLFSKNSSINSSDESVQNVNFESIMNNISSFFDNFKTAAQIYEYCGYVRAGAAAVGLVTTVLSFIPIVGQGLKAIQLTAKAVAKTVIKGAVRLAIYTIVPIAAKKITNMKLKDVATEWFGEDRGNAMISGASKYLGGNGTSGGQSPGSTNKVLTYLNVQNTVIADEARYQRAIRSPFDITSQYTFLGSLAYSLIPMAYSSGGVMSVIKDVSSTVSSSVVAMLPTVNAIDNQSVLTSSGQCDLLDVVDVQGDAFCNPYIITDTSTINMAAEDVIEIVRNMKEGGSEIASIRSQVAGLDSNFEGDGKTIKKNSPLAKYTLFCGQRTSQYGIKDAQIASALSGESSTAVKILSRVPLINDAVAIGTGIAEEAGMKWANGRACVASDENPDWEREYKYYQRYDEIQRFLENVDPKYKSPVTAFLNDYYEENPLDTTFEGTLARFSGMTKEKVEDTLALIEYYQYLDEYDPLERYAFGASAVKVDSEIRFDNDNKLANNYFILLNQISFADVRNRSFAV